MTDKFTQKTLEALQSAQGMAIENENMQIAPEHLVYALADQDGGLIGSLLGKMGVDTDRFLASVDEAVANLPKVSGSGREPDKVYISRETEKILSEAEKAAKKAQDEYWRTVRAGVKDCEARVQRLGRTAEMEAKKSVLALKQDMVSRAFDSALERVLAMPEDGYDDSYAKLKYDDTARQDQVIIDRVAELADKRGVSMTEISLAWLLTKVTAPVVGATKLHHIRGAAKAVDLQLTEEEKKYLEEAYVPHKLVGVMAQNTPAAAKQEHVWSTGSQKIETK